MPRILPFVVGVVVTAALPGADAVDFATRVQPVLTVSCASCHGPAKQKAGLRLDSEAGIRAGGKSGPVVVPGRPDDSPLIQRTSLAPDDSDFMPSKGDPLTKAQIDMLRAWIANGAAFGGGGSAAAAPAAAPAPAPAAAAAAGGDAMAMGAAPEKPAAAGGPANGANADNLPAARPVVAPGSRPGGSATSAGIMGNAPPLPPFSAPPTTLDLAASGMAAADAGLLKRLDQAGGWSRALTKNQALLDIDLSHLPKPEALPAALEAVNALGDHVAWLDLAGTTVADQDLPAIAGLKNLRRLHLERTGVTDQGAAALAGARNLEWLDIYGTAIGDDGLAKLSGLTHLQRIFVWQTKATPAGIDALVSAIPGLHAERGEATPPPAPPGEGGGKGKKK